MLPECECPALVLRAACTECWPGSLCVINLPFGRGGIRMAGIQRKSRFAPELSFSEGEGLRVVQRGAYQEVRPGATISMLHSFRAE